MKKKVISIFLFTALFLIVGAGQAFSSTITFDEVANNTQNPTFSEIDGDVSFVSGAPAADPYLGFASFTENLTGDSFLLLGIDDFFVPFVDISALGGLIFGIVSFDMWTVGGLPAGDDVQIDAKSGATTEETQILTITPPATGITSVSFNIATGFDAISILGDWDYLAIDNFDFTVWQDPGPGPGPNPIPEPGTMFLFGFGILGMAAVRRKK